MSIEIRTKKDYWGAWVAKSRVPLEGERYLEINTSKDSRGQVVTRASAVKVEKEQGYEIVKFAPFSDYNKAVYVSDVKRVTEKVVREQQAKALADLPYIIENAKQFYAIKEVA